MKHIITLSLVLISVISQAQINKTIGEFNKLKVYDLINVELIKSDIERIEILGKNADDVVVINKNGTLKIRMNLLEKFDGNQTKVKLHYTKIDVIDANEGATIFTNQSIDQYEIELKVQEGAKINVPVNLSYLNIVAHTGGIIETKGKANQQDIKITTGGTVKNKDVDTGFIKVNIKAGGEAELDATELIDIKIRAGGQVFIFGNPQTVNQNKIIGGKVTRVN